MEHVSRCSQISF